MARRPQVAVPGTKSSWSMRLPAPALAPARRAAAAGTQDAGGSAARDVADERPYLDTQDCNAPHKALEPLR